VAPAVGVRAKFMSKTRKSGVEAEELADPYWILGKAVEAFNHHQGELVGGWLARLRLRFSNLPFLNADTEVIEAEALTDTRNPYWLLQQAIDATERSQVARAVGLLAMLNRLLGAPPFESPAEIHEAMVLAGFGELPLTETGLDLPGHHGG
jgi:hypothetical protein